MHVVSAASQAKVCMLEGVGTHSITNDYQAVGRVQSSTPQCLICIAKTVGGAGSMVIQGSWQCSWRSLGGPFCLEPPIFSCVGPSHCSELFHFRAALKGTNLRGQTPICGFLRFPAVFCGFLRKSAFFCENLRESAFWFGLSP